MEYVNIYAGIETLITQRPCISI